MKFHKPLILLLISLPLLSCSSDDESGEGQSMSNSERISRIEELDHKLSELIKDIEFSNNTTYPKNYGKFSNNSSFNNLVSEIKNLETGSYTSSSSKFLRSEAERAKVLLNRSPSLLAEFWVHSTSSVNNDRKGHGKQITIRCQPQTLVPVVVKLNAGIRLEYEDVAYFTGEYERSEGYGSSKYKTLELPEEYTCDSNGNVGSFVIWDRARGEQWQGIEFTKASDNKYTGKRVGGIGFRTIKRYSRGWKVGEITPKSAELK